MGHVRTLTIHERASEWTPKYCISQYNIVLGLRLDCREPHALVQFVYCKTKLAVSSETGVCSSPSQLGLDMLNGCLRHSGPHGLSDPSRHVLLVLILLHSGHLVPSFLPLHFILLINVPLHISGRGGTGG